MITNFQLKPSICKFHHLPQLFICLNKICQQTTLICSDCSREHHHSHIHQLKSIDSFVQSFKQKVTYYESQFDHQKVVINVKEIVKTKINQLDQLMNQILVMVVKLIEKQKEIAKEKLLQLQSKYQILQAEYKKNLQARFDCLQYLVAYKNSPQALEAKIFCSSQWGIMSLKNTLTEIKNLSINQTRDVNEITGKILEEGDIILKEDSLLYKLKNYLAQHLAHRSARPPVRASRFNSFIEKSFNSPISNQPMITTPRTSRAIEEQRPRTFSMSNLYKGASGNQIGGNPTSIEKIASGKHESMEKIQASKLPSLDRIQVTKFPSTERIQVSKFPSTERIQITKQPSNERIPLKMSSQNSLDNMKYMRGLRKLRVDQVIIK